MPQMQTMPQMQPIQTPMQSMQSLQPMPMHSLPMQPMHSMPMQSLPMQPMQSLQHLPQNLLPQPQPQPPQLPSSAHVPHSPQQIPHQLLAPVSDASSALPAPSLTLATAVSSGPLASSAHHTASRVPVPLPSMLPKSIATSSSDAALITTPCPGVEPVAPIKATPVKATPVLAAVQASSPALRRPPPQ